MKNESGRKMGRQKVKEKEAKKIAQGYGKTREHSRCDVTADAKNDTS